MSEKAEEEKEAALVVVGPCLTAPGSVDSFSALPPPFLYGCRL